MDVRVALEPSELFAHIPTRVSLDALDGFLKSPRAIKVTEQFLIADGVESIQVTQVEQALCLIEHTGCHHLSQRYHGAQLRVLEHALLAERESQASADGDR